MADKQGTFEDGRTSDARSTITLNGDSGNFTIGCGPERPLAGQSGQLEIQHVDGQLLCRLGANPAVLGPQVGGRLALFDDVGEQTVTLGGQSADLRLGGSGRDGDVRVLDAAGHVTVRLEGADGTVRLGGGEGGPDGDLVIYAANLADTVLPRGTIHLDGAQSRARLGGHGTNGRLLLFGGNADMTDDRNATVAVDGAKGDCWIGGNGTNGNVMLFAAGTATADAQRGLRRGLRRHRRSLSRRRHGARCRGTTATVRQTVRQGRSGRDLRR
jgi:hypothetical protein